MKPLVPMRVPLEGRVLVEASAGSGKTHALTTLFARLMIERRLRVDQVLVVTYTRAATRELRGRIRARLSDLRAVLRPDPPARDEDFSDWVAQRRRESSDADLRTDREHLEQCLYSLDDASIFTIHGFCERVLLEHAFEGRSPFDFELVPDERPLAHEVAHDYWARASEQASALLLQHLSKKGVSPSTLAELAQRVAEQPDLALVPLDADDRLPAAEATWQRALHQAGRAWWDHRTAILDTLLESSGLKRNEYPIHSIRHTWGPELDRTFHPPYARNTQPLAPTAIRPPRLRKLTAQGIERGTKKGHLPPQHVFFELCGELERAWDELDEALDGARGRFESDLVGFARRELSTRKETAGVLGFADLLHHLRHALEGSHGERLCAQLRSRWPVALIDEFQDTDPTQYAIFRRIYRKTGTLFLIGDPKQAIYGFRGADVFAYLQAARDTQDRTFTLNRNWRSKPALVQAINALFSRSASPFLLDTIGFTAAEPARTGDPNPSDGAPLEILFARRPEAERRIPKGRAEGLVAEGVALEIAAWLAARPKRHRSDVAVLCRTNAQAQRVQQALAELQVPSVFEGDQSVLDTPEAEDLERLMAGLARPTDARSVRGALAGSLLGLDAEQLTTLAEHETEWEHWLARFDRWHARWEKSGFLPAFHRLAHDVGLSPRLLLLPDGPRRLTHVLHLAELAHRTASEANLGPLGTLQWLGAVRRNEQARQGLAHEDIQLRRDTDADAVRLSTIHQSKGLEYPVVYCPFLWDGTLLKGHDARHVRFHDPDDRHRLKLDLGSSDLAKHRALAELESLAENLRLVYVALTRAKEACTVVWGGFQSFETSPLGYLLHPDPTGEPGEPGEPGAASAAVAQRLGALDDAQLRTELEALVHAASGAITLRDFDPPAVPTRVRARETVSPLRAKTPTRSWDRVWRATSFSQLTASETPLAGGEPGSPASPPTPTELPQGARFGRLVHDVLEHVPHDGRTSEPHEDPLRNLVHAALGRQGYPSQWTEPVHTFLQRILDTPLPIAPTRLQPPPEEPTLGQVLATDCLKEFGFVFPVAQEGTAVKPERLAQVFRRHGAPTDRPQYAADLAQLGFEPFSGWLRGFVDLAFEWNGRWYLVDYKSNRLGPDSSGYTPDAIQEEMAHHHYFLQYHLYCVALHRYLRQRLPDWEWERGFGAVQFLFLRGMSPDGARGEGIFCDRPSAALIEDLSAALDGDR